MRALSAPIVQKPAENRSITSAAVSNASSIPEIDLAEETIDVTPRTMDTDPNQQFSPITQSTSAKAPLDKHDAEHPKAQTQYHSSKQHIDPKLI